MYLYLSIYLSIYLFQTETLSDATPGMAGFLNIGGIAAFALFALLGKTTKINKISWLIADS